MFISTLLSDFLDGLEAECGHEQDPQRGSTGAENFHHSLLT